MADIDIDIAIETDTATGTEESVILRAISAAWDDTDPQDPAEVSVVLTDDAAVFVPPRSTANPSIIARLERHRRTSRCCPAHPPDHQKESARV